MLRLYLFTTSEGRCLRSFFWLSLLVSVLALLPVYAVLFVRAHALVCCFLAGVTRRISCTEPEEIPPILVFHWHFFSSSQNSSIANPKSICGEHHGVPREPVHLRRGSHQYGHCGHAWRYVSIRFRCCIYRFAVEKPNCWYLLITVC